VIDENRLADAPRSHEDDRALRSRLPHQPFERRKVSPTREALDFCIDAGPGPPPRVVEAEAAFYFLLRDLEHADETRSTI
jgi:hypothetical protein